MLDNIFGGNQFSWKKCQLLFFWLHFNDINQLKAFDSKGREYESDSDSSDDESIPSPIGSPLHETGACKYLH